MVGQAQMGERNKTQQTQMEMPPAVAVVAQMV
jgi:hypothetical protein